MSLLCLNAGSSSLKFALFDHGEPSAGAALPEATLRGEIDAPGGRAQLRVQAAGQPPQVLPAGGVRGQIGSEVAWLLDWLRGQGLAPPRTVVHRIVHGGETFTAATVVTPAVLAQLAALAALAPLHQGPGLDGVRAAQAALPQARHVACFDTAFHAGQAAAMRRYAIPAEWDARGFRKYGFHGLSYAAIARQLPAWLGVRAEAAVVVAHLGSGASLCGLRGRRSVSTTMGLTPLDGLVMATRSGALDPGLVLLLCRQPGMDAAAVEDLLYHRSGLLGVSGRSGDLRDLAAADDDPAARLAIDLFVASVVRLVGAVAADLGGLDALVFTGGIGTHQPAIRAEVVRRLGWLGLRLDAAANAAGTGCISASDSAVPVLALATDEEAMMALEAAALPEETA